MRNTIFDFIAHLSRLYRMLYKLLIIQYSLIALIIYHQSFITSKKVSKSIFIYKTLLQLVTFLYYLIVKTFVNFNPGLNRIFKKMSKKLLKNKFVLIAGGSYGLESSIVDKL
jgi:hypothetical protein